MIDEGRLDRAEDDGVAADLDHEVAAAEDLELPVGEEPGPVTRAVHEGRPGFVLLGRRREGIGDESSRRELGKVEVPPGQHIAAEIQLARLPKRQRLALLVQNVAELVARVSHGAELVGRAEVDVRRRQVQRGDLVALADGVQVKKPDGGEAVDDLLPQREADHLPVEVDRLNLAESTIDVLGVDRDQHVLEQTGREEYLGDPEPLDHDREPLPVVDDVGRHGQHGPAPHEWTQALPDEEDVARHDVPRRVVRKCAEAPVVRDGGGAVGVGDALGLARGAGGVHDEAQVVGSRDGLRPGRLVLGPVPPVRRQQSVQLRLVEAPLSAVLVVRAVVLADYGDLPGGRGELPHVLQRGADRARPGVEQDLLHHGSGVRELQGNVGAPRREGGEHRDYVAGAGVHVDGHDAVGRGPRRAELGR
mmetsp:Transcript_33973/g.76440  ORF Transcript_33973/g.76440 Transcript_33973/m.76440 type:complete len:419 (-) Transcript_33973:244-1500(-)